MKQTVSAAWVKFLEYMETGGPVMWVILALSVVAAAIAIERTVYFAYRSDSPGRAEADFSRAEGGEPFPPGGGSLRGLFRDALANGGLESGDLKWLLEERVWRELRDWETNMNLLDVTARVSPLLGLLGTVLGMVGMFHSLHAGSAVNSSLVTAGIWKALFTTVAGLSAAIPITLAHGMLSSWIDGEEKKLSQAVDFIMRKRMGGDDAR